VTIPGGTFSRLAAVCCLATSAALAGCEGTTGTPGESAQPAARATAAGGSAPSATATAHREAADRAAVEAAYRQFWVVLVTFDQRYPEREWPRVLGRVAIDPELGLVLANTRQQRRIGMKVYGYVIPRPTVLPINGANRAQVTDPGCLQVGASRCQDWAAEDGRGTS